LSSGYGAQKKLRWIREMSTGSGTGVMRGALGAGEDGEHDDPDDARDDGNGDPGGARGGLVTATSCVDRKIVEVVWVSISQGVEGVGSTRLSYSGC